jgi:DNA-binding XRE family transcriptional regulator
MEESLLLIKELRLSNRMTQKEFAEKVGVSCQTISAWENETKLPSISNCRKIEKMFGVKLAYHYGKYTVA